MFELYGFRQIGGWVAAQVAYADAAVEIATDVIANPSPSIGTGNARAEHGGALAAINMVAPAAHMSARTSAVIDHAAQRDAPQLSLHGHYNKPLMAIGVYPAKVIQNSPIHMLDIRESKIAGPFARKDAANLFVGDGVDDSTPLFENRLAGQAQCTVVRGGFPQCRGACH